MYRSLIFPRGISTCGAIFLLYYSGLPNDLGDYDETPDVTAQHMKVVCAHTVSIHFIAQFLCLWWSTLLTLYWTSPKIYNVATQHEASIWALSAYYFASIVCNCVYCVVSWSLYCHCCVFHVLQSFAEGGLVNIGGGCCGTTPAHIK